MQREPHQLPAQKFAPAAGADAQERTAAALEYIAEMMFRIDGKLTDLTRSVGYPGSAGATTGSLPIKNLLADVLAAIQALRPKA